MTTFSLFLSLFFWENHKGYLSTCRLFHSVRHGKSRRHTTSDEGKYRLVGTTAIETAPVWNQNKAYILPVCLAHLILKVIWKYSVESIIFPHPNHISWMADTSTICMYSIMVITYVVIAKVLMLVLLLKRLIKCSAIDDCPVSPSSFDVENHPCCSVECVALASSRV